MKSAKMNFVNYVKRFAIAVALSGWLVSVVPQASAQAKVQGWTVGNKGTILYYNPKTNKWQQEAENVVTANLKAVASPDGKTAWAVGNSPKPGQSGKPGTILYFDGTVKDKKQVWVLQDTDPRGKQLALGDLYGIFALNGTHAWIVGQGGTIFFTNSAGKKGWQRQDFPRGLANDLYGVYFTSVENSFYGWAVGDKGTIFYYDGEKWVKAAGTFPNTSAKFTSVSGYTVGDRKQKTVYLTAVGDRELGIWKCQGLASNNNKWTRATGKEGKLKDRQDLKVVQVVSAKNKWVGQTGSPDNVYQWNGTDWISQPTLNKFDDVYGLSVSPDGNSAWAVGEKGNIAYSGRIKKGKFEWILQDNPQPIEGRQQLNGIVMRSVPKQQMKLGQAASPDSGVADVNYVSVTGSDFPAGDINAANVVVEFASDCHERALATTPAVSIVSGSGDSQLVSFLLPAGLDPGQYFISISDSEEGDANFESGNCAVVDIVQ